MSLNDHEDIRQMFKAFRKVKIATKYSAGNSRTRADTRSVARFELLIHNLS